MISLLIVVRKVQVKSKFSSVTSLAVADNCKINADCTMHNVTESVKFISTSIRMFSFRGMPAIEFTICWSFIVQLTEDIDLG